MLFRSACATFAAFSLFTLNIVLEKKPPEEFSGIVLEKFTESQKHSLSHFLVVPVPDQVPGFKENTNIRVSPEDYRAVVPGSTTIKVFWHKGFFRIPWLKSYLLNRISH